MPHIKLAAVLALGLGSLTVWPQAGVCLLLALLDGAQSVPAGDRRSYWLREFIAVLGQAASARVWPFYLVLWLMLGLPQLLQEPVAGSTGWKAYNTLEGTAWKGSHQPGQGGLCACGKPLGHDKITSKPTAPAAAVSAQEMTRRIEALKQRSMTQPKAPAAK